MCEAELNTFTRLDALGLGTLGLTYVTTKQDDMIV